MTTLPPPQSPARADLFQDVIEAASEAGFEPADESEIDWIARRYDGYQKAWFGWLAFRTTDGEIVLHLMTPYGVQQAEARFTLNPLGVTMFAAAAKAL